IADQTYGIGRGLCAIVPDAQHSLRYIFYALQVVKMELWANATGSTYEAVSINQVANVTCLVPPVDEQMALSSFLDCETAQIDALIEEQRRLIGLLTEKRQAVISKAVTKGLNASARMKPSGIEWLGDVPEHWTITKLGRVASVTKLTGFEYTNYWRAVPD